MPLFVFDQTKDAESLNKNKNFIHSLQQETNARIAFIDMKQIKEGAVLGSGLINCQKGKKFLLSA